MSSSSALDAFLDKWRRRWPEWAVAEAFVPAPQRARTVAWFALLQEFDDILNIAGDPLPGPTAQFLAPPRQLGVGRQRIAAGVEHVVELLQQRKPRHCQLAL